jgi:hypothetical protein
MITAEASMDVTHTVFSQPTRGFGQRAPHLVSADFTLNFDPLYLNQYGSN